MNSKRYPSYHSGTKQSGQKCNGTQSNHSPVYKDAGFSKPFFTFKIIPGEESIHNDREQVSCGKKCRHQKYCRSQNSEDSGRPRKCRRRNLPLTDKAAHGRNTHKRQGREHKAPHGDRQCPADSLEFLNVVGIQHDDKDTCRQEETALGTHMADHLQEASPQTIFTEKREGKENIGDLADR